MELKWSTEIQDMLYAQYFMEQYAAQFDKNIHLFEVVVDKTAKKMGYALARWVVDLAHHFHMQYGPEKGDFVVRQVISRYMTIGETKH